MVTENNLANDIKVTAQTAAVLNSTRKRSQKCLFALGIQ